MDKNKKMGLLLIAAGILSLAGQLGFFQGVSALYLLSLAFLSIYVVTGGRRQYGNVAWLIPGLILLAVGIGTHWADRPEVQFPEESIVFLISAAFFAVYFLHTRVCGYDWSTRNWPLIPASILMVSGFINNPNFFGNFTYVIAAILILGGLRMMRQPPKS